MVAICLSKKEKKTFQDLFSSFPEGLYQLHVSGARWEELPIPTAFLCEGSQVPQQLPCSGKPAVPAACQDGRTAGHHSF